MTWRVQIGSSGGVLNTHTAIADLNFNDPLFDYGACTVVLAGLEGFAAPAPGKVLRVLWDGVEQWAGIIDGAQKGSQGDIYVVQAYTPDAQLHAGQTGGIRNYLAQTPLQIIQTSVSPSPLLVNSQAATVLIYGVAAGVPNKVDGANPGTALTQFVADSTTLYQNMRRLCLQARYDGASYGLEWLGRMEGANNSDPRFYLVKRRERAAVYAAETFDVPGTLYESLRGSPSFAGVDAVRVIGAGDGVSRIESALAGAGTREAIFEDKAILQVTNANNMANRLLEVYGKSKEFIIGKTWKHGHLSRAGDTATVTQSGHAPASVRVIERIYSLRDRTFVLVFGRPDSYMRDKANSIDRVLGTQTTSPQFTDTKPDLLEATTQRVRAIRTNSVAIPAGTSAVICDTAVHGIGPGNASLADLLKCDGLLLQALLVSNAANVRIQSNGHSVTYEKTTSVTIGLSDSGNADVDPHGHTATPNHTITAAGGSVAAPLLAGPFQLIGFVDFAAGPVGVQFYQAVLPHLDGGHTYGDMRTYQFSLKDLNGGYSPSRVYLLLRNDGDLNLTVDAGTEFGVYRDNLHSHNEL